MPPIGETLRDARLRRKLEIADVEAQTKIRAKYLRAMEHEEWAALPGPTYVRTFLRTYADVLGIDAQLLLDEYRADHREEEPDFAPLAGPPIAGRDRRRRARPPGPGLVFVALLVALVGLLLALGLTGEDNGSGGGDQAGERAPASDARESADRGGRRDAGPAARRVTLRLAPSQPTYACIDRGSGSDPIFEGTLSRARSFRDPRTLRVNLGRRTVDLRANGRRVRVPSGSQPIGYEVDRRGARELRSQRPCA